MFLRRILAGLLALSSMPFACAATSPATASGLIASLQVDCRRLGIGDELALTLTLRNAGAQPLVLYRQMGWGGGEGLGLRVSDFDGTDMAAPPAMESHLDPARLADPASYLTLLPQRAVQLVRHVPIAALVPGPGNYRLRAEYVSPVGAAQALPKAYFWSREAGAVVTPALSLEVGQSPACPAAGDAG